MAEIDVLDIELALEDILKDLPSMAVQQQSVALVDKMKRLGSGLTFDTPMRL